MKVLYYCITVLITGMFLFCTDFTYEVNAAEQRMDKLQAKAAEEISAYYNGSDNWYRCAVLLRKIERLEKRMAGN